MIFPDYFSRYANGWGSWILLSATGLILLRKFQSWYRLRHFKGPFIASLTRLWLVRCITGGRMHLDFQEVNQKYGMCGYDSYGEDITAYGINKTFRDSGKSWSQ